MDKNQVIGLTLILLIVIGWSALTTPSVEELERQKFVQDSISRSEQLASGQVSPSTATAITLAEPTAAQDSLAAIERSQSYGDFAQSAIGEAQAYDLKSDKAIFTFTNKGARLSKVNILDHKKIMEGEDKEEIKTELLLLEDERNKFEYLIPVNGKIISTQDLFFTASPSADKITFTANAGSGQIIQEYRLLDDGYTLDYDIKFVNLNNVIDRNTAIKLNWHNWLDRLEKNVTFEKYYSSVYFKETDEGTDYCSCRSDDEIALEGKRVQWASHVNQYFNTSLMAKGESFAGGIFETSVTEMESEDLKLIKTTLDIPYDHNSNETFAMQVYAGPNVFENLQAFDNDLEDIIPYGRSIFGTINRRMIRPFFNWLSGFVGSKGVVIIIMILLLKILLYPLMYKMLASQAKMGSLKPKLAGLKEKFKDEPQKVQMETMKIYREYGVSPLSGCLPMLPQMPIWYALFRFFPADITFRQESFLWATDLSSYDAVFNLPFTIPMIGSHLSLFTILYSISMVAYTYYNTKHMDMSANPAMKYVQYLMPIMFFGFFNSYASALTCYMLFSNLINIVQTVGTKTFVFNDEKILAELEEKKKNAKPKKKSGFQARLEEAMAQQKKIQEQNKKKSKGKK